MEVRDPIHGSIQIVDEEKPIIAHPFFQRLRSIKQLGFSEYVFPGATHTRYLHSIGVMDVASKVFDQLFKEHDQNNLDVIRLKETLRLACLLHDIGHAPLSHTTEVVMPSIEKLKLPTKFNLGINRQATHEDYTIKSIVDSSFTESFKQVGEKFGVNCDAVAELVIGRTTDPGYFTFNGVNYFQILHQCVSSELDCDRMDYLLRDSYFCGVSYGNFDLDWLIDNLHPCIENGNATLGIDERAVATFDDFLLSRFHMFLQVYFHYRAVCLEKILYRYFENSPTEYAIPANIEEYLIHDDHYLMKVLRNSSNQWAKKIVNNIIPPKILETFGEDQLPKLNELEQFLKSKDIDYIKCASSGRLSKYYSSLDNIQPPIQSKRVASLSMKVIRHQTIGKKSHTFRDVDQATDLYSKYSKTHTINRIHCEFEQLDESNRKEIIKILES